MTNFAQLAQSEQPALLFEDLDLVAVHKPAGLAVHRGEHAQRGERYLLQWLAAELQQPVWLIHRLDRPTSGVMIAAKSPGIVQTFAMALAAEGAEKRYWALVRGVPAVRFASDRPLKDESGVERKAESAFETLVHFGSCALVQVRIHTGRHHQIRRHLNHLSHHVAGDTTHGKGWFNQRLRETIGLSRLFLHSRRLSFRDPRDGALRIFEAPLPKSLLDPLHCLASHMLRRD